MIDIRFETPQICTINAFERQNYFGLYMFACKDLLLQTLCNILKWKRYKRVQF